MRFTIKFLLLVQITLAAIVALGPAKPALACSGPPQSFEEILARAQYVVKATVVETDDLGQNYILEAETYLAGGPGPKYLSFGLNQPEMIEGLLLDLYGFGDCKRLYRRVEVGKSAYWFVYRREDGSYATASFNSIFYPDFTLKLPATEEKVFELYVDLYEPNGRGYWRPTEQEFVDFIAERTGDTPTSPDSNSLYPMQAPLLLSTTAESLYLLPMDFGPPVKLEPDSQLYADYVIPRYHGSCASLNCHSTSPNGLFNGTQTETNEITVGSFDDFGITITVEGQGFLFSSTSEAIVIWNSANLEIRYVRYPYGAMREYDMDLINTTELHVSSEHVFESLVGVAQWSPDGRFLAFTDTDGLWLWDVYTENVEPRLLIPVAENGDLPIANYFSPRGRYLAFSQGATKETLDTVSGQHYPYGLVSPNERGLLAFESSLPDTSLNVCTFTPYSCTDDVMFHVRQAAWQDSRSFITVSCYPNEDCNLTTHSPSESYNAGFATYSQVPGEMFTYDSQLDLLAVLSEGYTVTINDTALDLTDSLDGYVVSMEWLPSMFYFVD